MVIDEISDETSYSISDRKFYVQSVTLKLMAYIIEKKDFEVKKYPKRMNLTLNGNKIKKNLPLVEIEEIENPNKNKTLNVNIEFKPYHSKVEFDFDTDMNIETIRTENVRNIRIMVNDTLYYTEKGFKLHNGDNVRIQIKPIIEEEKCFIQFIGYDPNQFYNPNEVSEKVYDESITHEDINIV